MGRPPNSIEPFAASEVDQDEDMAKNGVSPKAATAMYVVIAVVLVALFALVGIGLHIPTGG